MANLFFLDTEAFDHTQFDVLTLDGEEGISRPFRFEVTGKASDALPFDLDGLGGRARLQVRQHDGTLRFIVGAIRSVRVDGHLGASRRLRFEVMPELWIAGERRRNRIFQDLSVTEIVAAILEELGIKHDFRVQNVQASGVEVHPRRAYCVQYQESDIDFILRILADEGIFFLFESDENSSTMVFADNETIYKSLGPLPFAHDLSAKDDHVTEFASQHSVRAGSVMFRDYDFRRPRLDQTVIASAPIGRDAPTSLEVYEFPGGYVDPARGRLRARSRLEELRRDAVVGTGAGTTRRLRPGASFVLVGHPVAELDVPWAVTFVSHSGQAIGLDTPTGSVTYQCSFECVPASVPFLPQRAPRRIVAAVETATVTGETSEEITVDPEGRVHVQFHWDRDGERNERSSCAIRVAQPWAGTGFGLWFAPRAGMEVVVSFVGGDPDQPLITGCVYNGEHPLPLKLPEHKTRSTIRTQSSPKGEGFNELRFEDLAGREQIFLHAQRDYDQTIRGNHSRQVGGNQTVTVGQDLVTRIGHDRTTAIAGDAETRVGGSYRLSADGSLVLSANVDGTTTISSQPAHLSVSAPNINLRTTESAGSFGAFGASVAQVSSTGRAILEAGPETSRNDNRVVVSTDHGIEMTSAKDLIMDAIGGRVHLRSRNGELEVLSNDGLKISSLNDTVEIHGVENVVIRAGKTLTFYAQSVNFST